MSPKYALGGLKIHFPETNRQKSKKINRKWAIININLRRERIKTTFKAFAGKFPGCGLENLIEFYSVFGGMEEEIGICIQNPILDEIRDKILFVFKKIENRTFKGLGFPFEQKQLLVAIARGDRKVLTACKKADLPESVGKNHFEELIERRIIAKELSREIPPKREPGQKLKKGFRRYRISHKIKFTLPFYRFWFTFIEPHRDLILQKEYELVLGMILEGFDKYVSFTFEDLSGELIKKHTSGMTQTGGYWDKKIEIDLLGLAEHGTIIAGECKWKNHKICKNTLNLLRHKCSVSRIEADYFALFSKSGFSKELINLKDEKILLFDINSFGSLLH